MFECVPLLIYIVAVMKLIRFTIDIPLQPTFQLVPTSRPFSAAKTGRAQQRKRQRLSRAHHFHRMGTSVWEVLPARRYRV